MDPHRLPVRVLLLTLLLVPPWAGHVFLPTPGRRGLLLELAGLPRLRPLRTGRVPAAPVGGRYC